MLRLAGVSYRYPGAGRDTLHTVDLELAPGTITGLVGPAEAGKSTLCLVAGGLAPRVVGGRLVGEVTLDGEDVRHWPIHRLAEHVVTGLQDPAGQLSLIADTVFAEVAFGPANLGLPLDEVRQRTEDALRAVGIEELRERDPVRLSGGQQQLVVIAGLLALRPRYLVLDEPLAHLDAAGAKLVLVAVRAAAAAGAGVLMAEQRTEALAEICDSLVCIAAGNTVLTGSPGEVLADPAVLALGVQEPAAARIRRHLRTVGLDPDLVEATSMSELRLEEVEYDYPGGVRALDGVDLVVPAGSSLAIVGANGSGKTTLARHLDGLLRPTAGRVLVDGEDAASRTVAQLARTVGLCFQHPDRQIFSRVVRDEVEFGPKQLGLSAEEAFARAQTVLAQVGLERELGSHPDDLGETRRKLLSIASVLAMDTPVVVLDEPTTGLDAHGVARVAGLVGELVAAGRTVIGISHDLRFVAQTFTRVVVLDRGRVALDGAPAEVFAEGAWETLREAGLEPPVAAVMGARLGLGSTPTEEALVEALAAGPWPD